MEKLDAVTAKRPKTVIQHILAHGFVTTEELKALGYEHAPRAARDVRELGIPLETFYVKSRTGRRIAAYRFGDYAEGGDVLSKKAGRTAHSKALKAALSAKYGSRCFIYLLPMEESLLQVDHRIPYEIAGECQSTEVDSYMLLSPSANRAKSWACEHCPNWNRKVATTLGVSMKTLFEPLDDVEGYIRIGEHVHQFNSREELNAILNSK